MTFEKCAQKLGFEINPKTGYFTFHSEVDRKKILAFLFLWNGGIDSKSIAHYLSYPLKEVKNLSQSISDLFSAEKGFNEMCARFDEGCNDNVFYNEVMKVFIQSRAENIMEMVNHIGLDKIKKDNLLSPDNLAKDFNIPLHSVELILDGKSIDEVVDDFMSMDSRVWAKLLKNLD